MGNIYQITLGVHATAGMIGLLLFWWPVIAKKGSDSHKKIGNWFGMAMYVAGASALVLVFMLLTDPIAAKFGDQVLDEARRSAIIANSHRTASFLMVLGFLLIANIRVGTAVLNNKLDRTPLRRPSYLIPVVLLGGSALYLFSLALIHQQVLFYVFSILGLGNSFGMLRYAFRSEVKKGRWLIQHFANLLGAGIAAHTAFFVFGGQRYLETLFSGQAQLALWILPGVIGGVAITLLSRRYRARFSPSRGL